VVVADHVDIEHGLHLLDRLEPGLTSLHAEVLIQQSAVQPLDNAVGLGPTDPGPLVLDAFELEEQLVWMLVWAAAEFAAIVAQHCLNVCVMLLEGGQHVVVEQLHGGHRQLVGIEAAPGVAAGAVDRSL